MHHPVGTVRAACANGRIPPLTTSAAKRPSSLSLSLSFPIDFSWPGHMSYGSGGRRRRVFGGGGGGGDPPTSSTPFSLPLFPLANKVSFFLKKIGILQKIFSHFLKCERLARNTIVRKKKVFVIFFCLPDN